MLLKRIAASAVIAGVLVTVSWVPSMALDKGRGPLKKPTPSARAFVQSASSVSPNPAAGVGYSRLVFNDEFDSINTIDRTGTGADGYKWFTDRPFGWGKTTPSELSVNNGVLTINPNSNQPNYAIATTSPSSGRGQGYQYGYFEARLRFDPVNAPKSAGWPSFWGLSHEQIVGAGKPRSMEIDFFEAYHQPFRPYQDVYAGTVHDIVIGPPEITRANFGNNVKVFKGMDWKNFHTYGTLWEPGKITWYFDGVPQFSQAYFGDAPPVPNPGNLQAGIFSPLDTDTGGQTVVLGTGVNYPMEVDFVRVWQK